MQKIWTEGKGDRMPIKKDIMSVKDVIVMETAASLNVVAILSGTGLEMLVLLQAASMTKVSSIPIPVIKEFIWRISRKISHKTYLNCAKKWTLYKLNNLSIS